MLIGRCQDTFATQGQAADKEKTSVTTPSPKQERFSSSKCLTKAPGSSILTTLRGWDELELTNISGLCLVLLPRYFISRTVAFNLGTIHNYFLSYHAQISWGQFLLIKSGSQFHQVSYIKLIFIVLALRTNVCARTKRRCPIHFPI